MFEGVYSGVHVENPASRFERLQKLGDQPTRSDSKTPPVGQIKTCLQSGDYPRALDLLRSAAAEFPNDAELSELEKLAHDGVKRKDEADHLITESQELFAQQKSAEALQLLRKAYDLDKNNSLSRAILANALVEHAQSLVETDWLKAETLTNQALALNPAHPTAKTILSRILDQKQNSSVEDWVEQARKLQSSGDLFAALAWVAEGLAVHPHDPGLLQVQDAIQRDQDTRRRQARRGDLEDLRRLQREIDKATDAAAKQALAARIQAVAAKHWTDGEILSIANALLLRLGLVSKESSTERKRNKGATVILHVPRPSPPAPGAETSQPSQIPSSEAPATVLPVGAVPSSGSSPNPVPPIPVPTENIPTVIVPPTEVPAIQAPSRPVPAIQVAPSQALPSNVPQKKIPSSEVPLRTAPRGRVRTTPEAVIPPEQATLAAEELVLTEAKFTSPSRQTRPERSNSTTLIFVSAAAAAIILVAVTFFVTRRHYAASGAETPATAGTVSPPTTSAPSESAPVSGPAVSAPASSVAAQTTPEPPPPALQPSAGAAAKIAPDVQLPAESGPNVGTLIVVAGQDGARVLLNGKLQRQLTQGGQLRLPNLELKNYVVQVSKSGFQDPPQQMIRIRKGEETQLIFNLQPQFPPQPRLAALTIQGGTPGTTVFVDQSPVGTIQSDGTLTVSAINPGDHTVELRKERFKPRQFKEHFTVGGTTSLLIAADAALEAVPGELKITFTPANASVALVRGDLLKMVSSGVPLNLAAGTYTLTARTAERFTRSATVEVVSGQSKTVDLSLGPNGMSNWDDPGGWKQEKDGYIRKGGDFVLYGDTPASGTFVFSAMPAKGHLLQWVIHYTDPKNYVLIQMDDNNFYRAVIRNGQKTDEVQVPDKSDKKTFRTLQIRVSATEIVHQIKHGESWTVLDRWTQPGANFGLGKFGFYIPGNDQVALSSFAHYADLNVR